MKKEMNIFYIVEENDNLELIAQKYKINPLKIILKNKITPNQIKAGIILYIEN